MARRVPMRVVVPTPVKMGLMAGPKPIGMSVGVTGGGGTTDYERLRNKPSIEEVELTGDRKLGEFGVSKASNLDIINLFKK